MDLKEYLSREEYLPVYRVIEHNSEGEYEQTIELNEEVLEAEFDILEEAYFELKKKIFDDGSDHPASWTYPQPYLTQIPTQIVDLACLAQTEEKSKEGLQRMKKESKARREELEEYRDEKVRPFIEEMIEEHDIKYVAYRGDLTSDDRWITPFSDINVVLIAEESSEDLIETIKRGPGTVEVLDMINNRKGDEIIKEREGEPVVSYDLWNPESYRNRRESENLEQGTYAYQYFVEDETVFSNGSL